MDADQPVVDRRCPRCSTRMVLYGRRRRRWRCRPCYNTAHREHNRDWRGANPDYWSSWAARNPEKVDRVRQTRAARLATAAGGPFDHRRADYQARIVYYGGRCGYCFEASYQTLDHIIPVSRGGSNHAANIRPACIACNKSKGTKIFPTEWQPRRSPSDGIA